MGDDNPNWRPTRYKKQLWGCQLVFDFPIVKLLDYQAQSDTLETDPNPFAWIVLTHLKTGATRNDPEARLRWKFQLVKQLYSKGYDRADVLELFRFLDWLLALPKALEQTFQKQFIDYEATMSQPYISNIERRWEREAGEKVRVATEKAQVAIEQAQVAAEQAKVDTEKAKAEVKAEVKAENLTAQRKLLRRLTHRRFGEHAAEQLSGLYEHISDTDQLADVAEWIVDCETVENLKVRVEGIKP